MPMIGNWTANNPRDASLYFHIPFCSKKCPYCHFFVLPDRDHFKEQFLASISLEWKLRLPQLQGKKVVSIYFGGGTPSRLSLPQLETLLTMIRSSGLEIDPSCEITLEANPEDVTLSLLKGYYELGINRISLGIQSLDDAQLTVLQRQHAAQKGIDAILLANQAGLTNISIDLMYDIPHQSLSSWQSTLQRVSEQPITHLSLYNLTFEPHTVFFKRKKELSPHLPTDEDSLKLLTQALKSVEATHLSRYEISAFARPGMHSRHNTGYWTGRPFLGFGPSAFSYWEGERFRNIAHLNRYTEMLTRGEFPVDFQEKLTPPHNLAELFAIRLRLCEGVDLSRFEKSHGTFAPEFRQKLQDLVTKGWLARQGTTYALTEQGQLFYDSVAAELI